MVSGGSPHPATRRALLRYQGNGETQRKRRLKVGGDVTEKLAGVSLDMTSIASEHNRPLLFPPKMEEPAFQPAPPGEGVLSAPAQPR